jgi:hypothetical protein
MFATVEAVSVEARGILARSGVLRSFFVGRLDVSDAPS